MELDDFLQEQREGGTEDSEGVFTLAKEKASWKLADYLLTTPDMFPVHLLACAVAGGATHFSASRNRLTRVDTFHFDGEPLSLDQLHKLTSPMVERSTSRLKDLGAALSVAGAGGRVRLVSRGRKKTLELRIGPDRRVTVSEGPAEPHKSGHSIMVKYESRPVSLGLLKDKGRLAPLHLRVDGAIIEDFDDLGMQQQQLYARYLRRGQETLRFLEVDSCEYPIASITKEGDVRSMAIGLCWPTFALNHGWVFVSHGVAYLFPQKRHRFPFACGIISASDLSRDLSGLGFVDNERFRRVWEEIDEAVDELILELLTADVDMSGLHRDLFNLELAKRQREKPSTELAVYLAGQDTLESPLDNLVTAAGLAAESQDWEALETLLIKQRARASLAYGHGVLEQTLGWLKREAVTLERAGRSSLETSQLRHYLQHIHQLSTPRSLECELTAVRKYRQLLTNLGSADLSVLEDLDLPTPWTAPIFKLLQRWGETCLKSKAEPSPDWKIAFTIWDACENRNFDGARDILKQMSTSPGGPSEERVWTLVIVRLYRGRMGFLEAKGWEISYHFQSTFAYTALEKRAQRLLPRDLSRWDDTESLLGKLHLGPVFLPLLMSRLIYLTRNERRKEALEFLGRALLQCSILWNGELKAPDSLAPFEAAFPPKRLFS